LRFEGGKVVDFGAQTGYDALKSLLDTDEGARHIGEIALIPASSPISQQGILYYNTLFDENASCHMALGDCYPDTTLGGENMSEEEVGTRGGNHSAVHVDFMFGTPDMKITGIAHDGGETPVFENGEFVL
ncbi:MAG: aminopeptidase, partial [Eubacteriales bacterium]